MDVEGLGVWMQEATHRQEEWHKMLGEVHEFERKDMLFLKKKVGYAMFGSPTTLPSYENYYTGYNKSQLENLEQIILKIMNKSNGKNILISFILLVIKLKDDGRDTCQDIVLKIHKNRSNSDSVFIDRHSRIYNSWEDFKKENLLPKCIYCYPQSGHYRQVWYPHYLDYSKSPACSFTKVAIDKLDSVAGVTSVATTGILVAGTFFTLAPAAAAVATVGTLGVGAYSAVRGLTSLFDRKTHGQSISVANQEARQSWLSIGTSVLAGAGGAVFSRAQRIASSGGEISKSSIKAMRTLNTATMIVSSISTIDTLFYCKEKYDNQALTPQDLFNLSCEVLFFFNAISSTKATNKLISVMETTHVTPNNTVKLTKSMKRRVKKRRAIRNQKLQTAVHECSEKYLTTISKRIMSVAMFAFVPNAEEIRNTVCCIGHDLRCLKLGTIDFTTFIMNSHANVKYLYMKFQNEFESAFSEIRELFIKKDKYITKFQHLLITASDSVKLYFNCVLFWVKLKFEKCMEHMGIIIADVYKSKNEGSQEMDEVSDDTSDCQEPHQKVFQQLIGLIENDELEVSSLEDYIRTFDFTCSTVMENLETKMVDYKRNCTFFEKISSKNAIDMYNHELGINGDPEEHFLNEIMNNYFNKFNMAKIKPVSLQKRSFCKNFEFWLNVGQGIQLYNYIDREGNGQFPTKVNMIHAICKITNKFINIENVETLVEDNGVIIFLPKENENSKMWFRGIFMHCSLTKDNAVLYLIMIY